MKKNWITWLIVIVIAVWAIERYTKYSIVSWIGKNE